MTASASQSAQSPRRQRISVVVAVVLMVSAAGIWWARSGSNRRDKTEWNAALQCGDCGHRYDANVKLTFPIAAKTCPSCERDAAWELKHCSKCSHSFLPALAGDPPRPPPMPACPRCGKNDDVGALVPGFSTVGEAG